MTKIFKKSFVITAAILTLWSGFATSVFSSNAVEIQEITSVLKGYEQYLNTNNVEAIVGLYLEDGVFMPQHSQAQIGKAAIRSAYNNVFNTIQLDVQFTIDEIEQISDTWAYARTHSEGTTTILANGAKVPESNNEIFLLKKTDNDEWKFARYIFSTTNPRQ